MEVFAGKTKPLRFFILNSKKIPLARSSLTTHKKKTMATPNNVMMNNVLDSIKSTLHEVNMMGFDSYAEQTIAFFEAVR